MERPPGMTSRPPAAIELTVGLLVPPLAREHVLNLLRLQNPTGRVPHSA